MNTAKSLCVIQCRIGTNAADRPCLLNIYGRLCRRFSTGRNIHRTTQKDNGKLKSFL